MTLEVDYVPWATGAGANVYTPAEYQALADLGSGVEPGLADGQQANTTWRLASMVAAAVATFISNVLQISVLDDGNLANLTTNFTNAVELGSATKPGRIVTSSAALNVLTSDYAIGLDRTAGVAATAVTLPAAAINQEFRIDDLSRNCGTGGGEYAITVSPPGGHTIAGAAGFVMNRNGMGVVFHYYGSSIWGAVGV